MEDKGNVTEKEPKAMRKQSPLPDPYPNKAKYESGSLFGFSINHFPKFNDQELKEQGHTDDQVKVIHEALAFHGLKSEELREARLNHQAAVLDEGKPKPEAEPAAEA
jgi:hypothetical protein